MGIILGRLIDAAARIELGNIRLQVSDTGTKRQVWSSYRSLSPLTSVQAPFSICSLGCSQLGRSVGVHPSDLVQCLTAICVQHREGHILLDECHRSSGLRLR